MCGREITGAPLKKIIEGAKLTVCYKCASFASGDWGERPAAPQRSAVIAAPPKPQPAPRRTPNRNDVEAMENMEFIEEYGKEIRKARQRLNLTEKQLAMKMQEKESIIKKLEQEQLVPDTRLLRKIKTHLGLDLIEKPEKEQKTVGIKAPTGRTIGEAVTR
jgi:putative transcription factor